MVNRENYKHVREYLGYQFEVKQLSELSVERYWFYLKHSLLWADETSFREAPSIRPVFATYLKSIAGRRGATNLAPESLRKIVNVTRRLFTWLKIRYPSEFRRVGVAWIDALTPPRVDVPPSPDHEFVELDEVLQLASLEIDKRDLALWRTQASAAFLFLSGMRIGAFSTLPIGAVDLENRTVRQWPSLGVKTKGSKMATTYLLEIPELLAVVNEWDVFVRERLPKTAMWSVPTSSSGFGERELSVEPPGEYRHTTIRKQLRGLFAVTGLPYRSPHRFRHGHAVYGLQRAQTMADYKAISINLMHTDITVTDSIYAPLASDEVQARITALSGRAATRVQLAADDELRAYIYSLASGDLPRVLTLVAERLAR
jgi:integrase